jgi:hypothetical protein
VPTLQCRSRNEHLDPIAAQIVPAARPRISGQHKYGDQNIPRNAEQTPDRRLRAALTCDLEAISANESRDLRGLLRWTERYLGADGLNVGKIRTGF